MSRPIGFDAAELDMIRHGDMLGPTLGARVYAALTAAIGAGGQAVAFQQRVQPWMMACFGPEISADKLEHADRFIEEAIELVQSGDYPRERIAALTEYVYSRPKGEPSQEVGGVEVTLAAYCLAHGLDKHECGETELARIWTKIEKIRAKHAAKPTGSELPASLSQPHPADERVVAEARRRYPLVDAADLPRKIENWTDGALLAALAQEGR